MSDVMKGRLLLPFVLLLSCAGMKPTIFIHPEFNFESVEKVAVLPFENLTKDLDAGACMSRLFTNELFAAKAFDVVEPGEVTKALDKRTMLHPNDPSQDILTALGKELGVQAIIIASVSESSTLHSSSGEETIITLVVRLVETDKGMTVWSATHTEGGRDIWNILFGINTKSKSEVMRRCIKRTITCLFK